MMVILFPNVETQNDDETYGRYVGY
jgi:hypothetical protein